MEQLLGNYPREVRREVEVAVVAAANPDGGDSPPAGIVWAQDPAPGEEDADIITVTISVNPTPPPPDDGDGSGDGGDDS